MTEDERRSARLLFAEELALGEVAAEALARPEVADAVRAKPVPSPLARRLQARALARGDLTVVRDGVLPLAVARRAVLGEGADAPARVLLRLDVVGGGALDADALTAVHAVLRRAGVAYLLTVALQGLDLAGQALLRRLADDGGVAFAVRPEPEGDAHAALDAAMEDLRGRALRAGVVSFAPGALRARDWAAAAQRFDVVAGSPEDVRGMGFHRTPLWRGGAVWLPAAGGGVDAVLAEVDAAREAAGAWLPVVLDVGELGRDRAALDRVAAALAGLARPWDELLAAVAVSSRPSGRSAG